MRETRADVGEEYLSQVAHELRGSLNAILGWAEFLRRSECDDSARVRAAETIIRHARQQSSMVTELMDIWRLSSGALKFNIGRVDVKRLIAEAIGIVQPLSPGRLIRFTSQADRDRSETIRGDARRLSQALVTLLLNAAHFAPDDTVVRVTYQPDGDSAQITVRDEGIAVPPSALPYLFERNRPPDRSCARGNFRLGLSFVRDVITHHGGSIEAESAGSSNGMAFRITLPTEVSSDDALPARPAVVDAAPHHALTELTGLRVLLVDDEPDAREALTGILQLHGAIVQTAGSAADAIAALQHDPFDVLLADIGMPGADGYDLIRYVRALETGSRHMPAAAVTAFASDADRHRALDAGFQVHLSKPVDPAALVATVAVLGRPRVMAR